MNADNFVAHYVAANTLLDQGRFDAAEAEFRLALRLRPENPIVHHLFGNLLYQVRRLPEALASYQQALRCSSDFGPAYGGILAMQRALCDLRGAASTEDQIVEYFARGRILAISPTDAFSIARLNALQLRLVNETFVTSSRTLATLLAQPPVCQQILAPKRSLRIGYLSGDFHDHATMRLLLGVLEAHDRTRLSVCCYSYGPNVDDPVRRRVIQASEAFRDIGALSDLEAAKQIASDCVDILVDLNGPLLRGRQGVVALRPAPVTVNWLGFPGTFGHRGLADYIIGDRVVTPPGSEEGYSETILGMPHCYQPNTRHPSPASLPLRADLGLPERSIVFCSFNQSNKLTLEMFSLWCRLLRKVKGSVLWILDPGFEEARARLRAQARRAGANPKQLVFAPSMPHSQHLARIQCADLALDTFPVTSHTTASDALWAGVPLITKVGQTFVSRVAASLLAAIGIPELITSSDESYEQLALELASDGPRLIDIRRRVERNRYSTPLFDEALFAEDLIRAYEVMWERKLAGAGRSG
jgi:predicted O-linked N-acetylglucosamine transferase (SPINDLY family)